jgi:hypothetical protein
MDWVMGGGSECLKLLYVFTTAGGGGRDSKYMKSLYILTPSPPLQLREGGSLEGVGSGTYVHKITNGVCT